MKVGDLVWVQTKLHGEKAGVILKTNTQQWVNGNKLFLVHIPGHITAQTLVLEQDVKLVS